MLLITGHKGFVGKNLTKYLDSIEYPWVGYDLLDGDDIRDKHNLECCFEQNQIKNVIHLAARAGVRRSKLYPEEYISTNILGTYNIAEMCERYDAKLIFYSSSAVFGNNDIGPIVESSFKNPISLYGISKLAGEHIVNNINCKTIIIRPFTVYGEEGRKDAVIFKWIEQIKNKLPITVYGDGSSCRGYVYVKDLVRATVELLNFPLAVKHEDFNLGGSEIIYLKDILGVFREIVGKELKITELPMPVEDIYHQYTDISKAKSIFGFNPQPHFIDNLKNIIYDELCIDNRKNHSQ